MRLFILVLVASIVAAIANAGVLSGGFATVIYTAESGQQWIDSGVIVHDFQQASPVKGYSLRTIEFTTHANQYHLDGGTVEVLYGR